MKKKMLTLILGCVMALSVVAIGVYALTTVNLGVTGSISFIAYDKQVYIEDITLKNIVEETDTGYQTTSKSYDNYQGVYLKNSNSTVDLSGKVLQGETMEIDITLKNLKANYLKTSLSHKALPEGVLIRSTGLYMPQNTGTSAATGESKTLKIYISNQSTSTYTLDLSSVNLSIAFEEVESLIHTGTRTEGSTTKTIYYVEMGTLPATTAVDGVYTEQYLQWRYISADGETAYAGNTAPTSTGGTYILETDVQTLTRNNSLLCPDGGGISSIAFQNSVSVEKKLRGDLSNINANDYAYSNLRKYINGQKVYKSSSGNPLNGYTANESSHYSDMLTDFCIDKENDLIFNRIVGRALSDLYSDIGVASSGTITDFSNYANMNGYDMGEVDKFWQPSYTEVVNLLCNGTYAAAAADWSTSNLDNYWLRTPDKSNLDFADGVLGSNGSCSGWMIYVTTYAARACFKLA